MKRDIRIEVESDMFYGWKLYGCNDEPTEEEIEAVRQYFEEFLIPQATEKGYVEWDNGVRAKCSRSMAKALYNKFRLD